MKNPFSFLFSSTGQAAIVPAGTAPVSANTIHDSYGYIHLPLEIDLHELQNKLNQKIPNGPVINQSNIMVNNQRDNHIATRVWKLSELIISEEAGMLCINMHIRVEVPFDYQNRWTGKLLVGMPTFTGRLQVKTTLTFENFELTPGLEVIQVAWDTGTTSFFYATTIKDYLSNKVIGFLKPLLASKISSYCNKETIIKQLEKVCAAKEVNQVHHTWYAVQPLTIYTSKLLIQRGKIAINLEMHAQLEVSVGQRPHLCFNGAGVQFNNHSIIPMGSLEARVPIFVSYLGLTDILQKSLLGRSLTADGLVEEPRERGGMLGKIVGSSLITKINLHLSGSRIEINIRLQGGVFAGNHQLVCLPAYRAQKNEIYLDQINHAIDSKSGVLLKTVNLTGILTRVIKQYAVLPLNPYIESGIRQVNNFFKKNEKLKGMVSAKVTSLSLKEVVLMESAFMFRFHARGDVSVRVIAQSAGRAVRTPDPDWVLV
jgi:hypothetical protein